MAILYKSYKGYDVKRHSYSAGSDFRQCPTYYALKRIHGWAEKERRAAMELGNATEAALKYYHEHGCESGVGVDEFKRLWLGQKDNAELTYKEGSESWADFYTAGAQLLQIYERKWKTFGYVNPQFQKQYTKQVFPSSSLDDLEFVAYVDMRADCPATGRELIADIKTSGATPPKQCVLVLDPQLRDYAWISGVPDVAFLWLERSALGGYKK